MRVPIRSLLLTVPVLTALLATPAGGADPVTTDGRRARVWAEITGGEATTSASFDGGGAAWRCSSAEFDIDGAFVDAPVLDAFPKETVFVPAELGRPTYGRYWVTCWNDAGARYDEIGWLQDVVDIDAIARSFAARYLAEELAPAVTVGAAPTGRTLVGTSTWFWVDGYDGSDLTSVHPLLGRTLVLRLALDEVTWTWGDGGAATFGRDGIGSPTGGDVTHRYRLRSTSTAAPDGAFAATAALTFTVSYTLEGRGPFEVTPALVSEASRPVVVREAQALLR